MRERRQPGARELRLRRLTAQQLAGPPAAGAVAVTERLLAIQGQDPRGARLAIRARSPVLTSAAIDRELSERRSLLITWLNRGTLHLVSSRDYWWLHALLTPPQDRASSRRLEQLGIDAASASRGVEVMRRGLRSAGPLTRHQLRDRLERSGLPTQGQALVHLLLRASLDGVMVRGPVIGNEHAYALVEDWLGPRPRFDRPPALTELARRYLAGHGPATEADLARWAGLPLRDVRAGLAGVRELVELPGGLLDLPTAAAAASLPPPRLLGAFEPLLMGWRSRELVLGEHEPQVVTGGIFRSFALAGGRAVALWRLRAGRVELSPLEELPARVAQGLQREADAVHRFLVVDQPSS